MTIHWTVLSVQLLFWLFYLNALYKLPKSEFILCCIVRFKYFCNFDFLCLCHFLNNEMLKGATVYNVDPVPMCTQCCVQLCSAWMECDQMWQIASPGLDIFIPASLADHSFKVRTVHGDEMFKNWAGHPHILDTSYSFKGTLLSCQYCYWISVLDKFSIYGCMSALRLELCWKANLGTSCLNIKHWSQRI